MAHNEPSDRWNRIFDAMDIGKPLYDDWLDKHETILRQSAQDPIIDLGCGYGCDTFYLVERGYKAIACDFSGEALRQVQRHVPEAAAMQLDLLEPLPFPDRFATVVIADLSLHYFRWSDTVRIVAEISRVLKPGGYLLARFNSVNDTLFGAGQGRELEPNYYETKDGCKRFFERDDLLRLFGLWECVYIQEADMYRYGKKKSLWEAAFRNLNRGEG